MPSKVPFRSATLVPPPNVAAVGYPPRPRHPFGRLKALLRAGAETLLGGADRRCVRCHSPHVVPAAPPDSEPRWTPLYCLFDCADCGHRWARYQFFDPFW